MTRISDDPSQALHLYAEPSRFTNFPSHTSSGNGADAGSMPARRNPERLISPEKPFAEKLAMLAFIGFVVLAFI